MRGNKKMNENKNWENRQYLEFMRKTGNKENNGFWKNFDKLYLLEIRKSMEITDDI